MHPGYLTSLVTRTNHNTIQTIGIYVRVFPTAEHAGQIFIPHRPSAHDMSNRYTASAEPNLGLGLRTGEGVASDYPSISEIRGLQTGLNAKD